MQNYKEYAQQASRQVAGLPAFQRYLLKPKCKAKVHYHSTLMRCKSHSRDL